MQDYYKKYIKYKIKYNILKKMVGGQSIPKPIKKLILLLKYGTEEIPFIGEIEALLFTIMSTKEVYQNIMTILDGKEITKLLTITLENGQEDLVEQFNTIYDDMSDELKEVICKQVPDIYDSVETFICNWISTIPGIGPATALIIQNSNVLNFDSFSSMYKKLPNKIKKLFETPEYLNTVINTFETNIRSLLINKKTDNDSQDGGSFFSNIRKKANNIKGDIVSNVSYYKEKTLEKTNNIKNNIKNSAKMIGDKIISNYFDNVLNPAVKISTKALKLLFPLFFSLLLLKEKCDN